MAVLLLLLLPLLLLGPPGAAALRVEIWPNAGMHGEPNITAAPSLDAVVLPSGVFSARVLGSFIPPAPGSPRWALACNSTGHGLSAFLHLDDHLVCQLGNDPNTWPDIRGGPKAPKRGVPYESVVPWPNTPSSAGKPYFLRATFVGTGSVPPPSFQLRHGAPPAPAASADTLVPTSAYSDELDAPHMQWLDMAHKQTDGVWGTWTKESLLAHTLLPHGLILNFGLCQISTGSCKTALVHDNGGDDDITRKGLFAYDASITQLYFKWNNLNVSVETSQIAGPHSDFVAMITPVVNQSATAVNLSDFAVVLVAMMADDKLPGTPNGGAPNWRRPGSLSLSTNATNGQLRCVPAGSGIAAVNVHGAEPTLPLATQQALGINASANPKWEEGQSYPYLAWPLAATGTAVSTGLARSVDAIRALIANATATEEAKIAKWGQLADTKFGIQNGCMWNVVYFPANPGAFSVTGGWQRAYVIFEWDSIFAAYLLSLDAKELAYNELITVIKTKSGSGVVTNGWQATGPMFDRTEPPIGAKVLSEMYRKHEDLWLVELLYGDLFDWQAWFWRTRRQPPLNLISLGSTLEPPECPEWNKQCSGGNMGSERDESGLDNSPMYDGCSSAEGCPSKCNCTEYGNDPAAGLFVPGSSLMALWDVGMSSMVAMELEALSGLADLLNKTEDAALLRQRLATLKGLVGEHLWDNETGVFVNKFSKNATFYRRISPTSFYPMLAGIATEAQAERMMGVLTSPEHFSVSEGGAGNTDNAFWPMPSIAASDPAFPALGYWRGFVWGPQIQLTYWALQHPAYANVAAVQTAKKALAAHSNEMFLSVWRGWRHVCENYSPRRYAAGGNTTTTSKCTGDFTYHWGGLAGFVQILEAGLY